MWWGRKQCVTATEEVRVCFLPSSPRDLCFNTENRKYFPINAAISKNIANLNICSARDLYFNTKNKKRKCFLIFVCDIWRQKTFFYFWALPTESKSEITQERKSLICQLPSSSNCPSDDLCIVIWISVLPNPSDREI